MWRRRSSPRRSSVLRRVNRRQPLPRHRCRPAPRGTRGSAHCVPVDGTASAPVGTPRRASDRGFCRFRLTRTWNSSPGLVAIFGPTCAVQFAPTYGQSWSRCNADAWIETIERFGGTKVFGSSPLGVERGMGDWVADCPATWGAWHHPSPRDHSYTHKEVKWGRFLNRSDL